MNDRTTLLKQALLVLLLVPWAPEHFQLNGTATAQSDAWVLGDQWGALLNAPATLGTPTLPVPLGEPAYDGTPAQHSQVVRSNGDGDILFFGIDGNIYDGAGYLIADALAPDCQQCLHPGVMEMHAVPVPNTCNLFFLITVNPSGLTTPSYGSRTQVSILDLNVQNPRFPNIPERRGRVLSLFNDNIDVLYPQFGAWAGSMFAAQNSNGSEVPGWLPTASAFPNKTSAPTIRIIDPTGTGAQYFMYVIFSRTILAYSITGAGIELVPTGNGGEIPIIESTNPSTQKSYSRDADVAMGPNSEIMLTVSDFSLNEWAPGTGTFSGIHPLLVLRFNAQDGALQEITGITLDGTGGLPDFDLTANMPPYPTGSIPGIKGCALIDGGTRILITGEALGASAWVPTIGVYDLGSTSWTDLITELAISSPVNYVRTRIHRNRYPGTGEPAVFIPLAGGLAAFKGTNNIPTMTFQPTVPTSSAVQLPVFEPGAFGDGGNEQPPYFLNAQITNDIFAETYAAAGEGACCIFREGYGGRPGTTIASSASWSATSNPFDDQAEVTFTSDVVVPAGVNLYVSNMTLRFAPQARLIVQRGARAHFQNTRLTSIDCANTRWPGIRVEGNTANLYQDNNPNLPVEAEQGWLTLNGNSIVENARYGVWCAREYETDTPDPAYFGGVVRATNSQFINCLIGVQVQNYHRFNANDIAIGPELPNRSLFNSCHFETTAAWPSGTPGWMAYMADVRHIKFVNCTFQNSAPQLFPPDETGGGIFLFNATAYVDGNSNPEEAYINGFYMGVFNASGVLNSVRVRKMHFDENVYGIADLQSSFVEYGENTFVVRDRGNAPNPRMGMLLWQTKNLTIEQNSFQGETREQSTGIFFVGYTAPETEQEAEQEPAWSYTDERIYNNTFSDLQAGTLLTGLMRGHAWGNQDAGLQIFCGDYTDNLFDIAVLPRTMIRPNQGGEDQLAGNRFYNIADCSSNYDWALDVEWNQIPGIYPMELDYIRHEFPDDLVGVSCDQWTDFNDFFLTGNGPFIKTQHCNGGVYPVDGLLRPVREASYLQAKNLLYEALATYNGTVDLGETPDLKQAIQQNNPWLSSSYLRDLMLAKHPLSDEVLVWLLKREVPMDPWHLTQVLLQNSKLNSGVWSYIKDNGLLSPFFYAMVEQAQQGTGITTKQALEQEIVQRRLEMTEQINVLGHIYARDTTGIPLDSLKNLMSHDPDHQFLQNKLELLLAEKRYAEAEALLNGAMALYNGREVMADLLTKQQSTNGEWKELNQADKDLLYLHAEKGKAGAARAAAILLSINAEAPLPPVRFPNFTKSRSLDRRSSPAIAEMEPAIACYPNPATTNSFITYPPELDGTAMSIHDVKGALVRSLTLNGNGLVAINVQDLDIGLYNLSVPGTSLSTKLNVQR